MNLTFYHRLKGFRNSSWSGIFVNPVDVSYIFSVEYRRRLFCLFDREYPYTLQIIYFDPKVAIESLRTGKDLEEKKYDPVFCLSLRYKQEEEVKKEVETILLMQQRIQETKQQELIKLTLATVRNEDGFHQSSSTISNPDSKTRKRRQ